MIVVLCRYGTIYGAFAAVIAKQSLQYRLQFWTKFFVQLVLLVVFVSFWQAVYEGRSTVGGLHASQTLQYVMWARIIGPMMDTFLLLNMGFYLRSGRIATELLRPTDFQFRSYSEHLSGALCTFVQTSLPMALVAMIFLGLRLPTDPVVWAAFGLCLLLGHGVVFLFDWLFSCVAFYTTETWGWQMLRSGFSQFFSGKLIPIALFPPVLFVIANILPFAQTIYVPASVLSGITPIHDVPRVVAIQAAWLVGLGWASRLLFTIALRKVTVQGG